MAIILVIKAVEVDNEAPTKSSIRVRTGNPVIVQEGDGSELVSNVRGGGGRRGGGARMGGRGGMIGGRRHMRWYPRNVGGGYIWNGAYWVDDGGLCYTKNWLGEYTLVDCGAVPSVVMGL